MKKDEIIDNIAMWVAFAVILILMIMVAQ